MLIATVELPAWTDSELDRAERALIRSRWDPPLNDSKKLPGNQYARELRLLKKPPRKEAAAHRIASEKAGHVAGLRGRTGNASWLDRLREERARET